MRTVARRSSWEEVGKAAETELLDGAGGCEPDAIYKTAWLDEGGGRGDYTRSPRGFGKAFLLSGVYRLRLVLKESFADTESMARLCIVLKDQLRRTPRNGGSRRNKDRYTSAERAASTLTKVAGVPHQYRSLPKSAGSVPSNFNPLVILGKTYSRETATKSGTILLPASTIMQMRSSAVASLIPSLRNIQRPLRSHISGNSPEGCSSNAIVSHANISFQSSLSLLLISKSTSRE